MSIDSNYPLQQLSSNFSFTEYCSTILTHNTIFYELGRLQQESDIYYEFPFHRQLSYITEISSFNSSKVTAEEVSEYYNQNNLTLPQDLADKTLQWYKIVVEFLIRDKDKLIYLNSYPQITKNDITKAIKTSALIGYKSFKVLDGIYYLCDLANQDCNTNFQNNLLNPTQTYLNGHMNNSSFYISQYADKIFEPFNKRALFQFIFSTVLSAMSKLALKRVNIDYSIQNLIFIREGQNIKFIYLPTFTRFASDLQYAYTSNTGNFNYKSFNDSYYLDSDEKLNKRFKDKALEFLHEFQETFLNEAEKRDIYGESGVIKDLMAGQKSIEDILSQQEQRKRFTKQLIYNNQILNLLMNNLKIKEQFLQLIEKENAARRDKEMLLLAGKQNGFQDSQQFQQQYSQIQMQEQTYQQQISIEDTPLGIGTTTQCQILNQFLQGCLALTKIGNNTEAQRFIFTCEDFFDRSRFVSNTLSQASTNYSSSTFQNSAKSQEDTASSDYVNSLFDSKRRLQITLRIVEMQGGSASQADQNAQIDLPFQSQQANNESQSQNLSNAMQFQLQQQQRLLGQTPSQIFQQQSLFQQYQSQQTKYITPPNLKAADKRLHINFSESDSLLTIRLVFLLSDIAISIDNTDDIIYTFQILNLEFAQFSIFFDEARQVVIESQVSTVDNDESVLLQMIYMIDRLIAYALSFYEFYQNNIQAIRVSRDTHKYGLFSLELYEILAGYQCKYNKFLQINKL